LFDGIIVEDNLELVILSEDNTGILKDFDCLKPDEIFADFNSKQRKKFKMHSKNINDFLVKGALEEQTHSFSTTHLLFYKENDSNYLTGFISLCADNIRLEISEKEDEDSTYTSIPSLKIARLGIDKDFQHKGLGTFMVNYAINIALNIRSFMGVKFLTVDCYQHRVSYYESLGFVINKIQKPNRESDNPLSLRLNIDKYLEKCE